MPLNTCVTTTRREKSIAKTSEPNPIHFHHSKTYNSFSQLDLALMGQILAKNKEVETSGSSRNPKIKTNIGELIGKYLRLN